MYKNGILIEDNGYMRTFNLDEYESKRKAGLIFTNMLGLIQPKENNLGQVKLELIHKSIKITINKNNIFFLGKKFKYTIKDKDLLYAFPHKNELIRTKQDSISVGELIDILSKFDKNEKVLFIDSGEDSYKIYGIFTMI